MNMRIEGVIVPLITPLDEQGRLDTKPVESLVNHLIAKGIAGLLPCGTTGEGPLLTLDERRQFAEAVVGAANGRVPVIIHTGSITTEETIQLTRHAQTIGAHAAAMIPPFYFRYSDEALCWHFESVAAQTPGFPIYLYNNPPVTGNPLSIELVSCLVERCPNIVGIKDSSGSLGLLTACSKLRGGSFNTANGCDENILASMAIGSDACVSGNANVVPELVVSLYHACRAGDLKRARELQAKLDLAHQAMGSGGDLSLFKAMLAKRGLEVGCVRKPLVQAATVTIEQCWQKLASLGISLEPILGN